MPMYLFRCECGETVERIVSSEVREVTCEKCGQPAQRQLSAPSMLVATGDGVYKQGTAYRNSR